MGVPALFRWLSKKYPKIIHPVLETGPVKIPGEDGEDIALPVDITTPNPNGMEFDNLYLDMNGIVHPCTHPEGKPAPETEEEMMAEIFMYTERVVNMVRPRKLLFMAIDGVAPRAKMNQQRSRRFRSSQEAKEKEEAKQEAFEIWRSMGKEVTEDMKKESWDSNAITPGTPFMTLLAESLRYWVVKKINTDPGWKEMQVYISDASVPGEGEHKIMDFIRRQRSNPGYDPNMKHVIYGLDADLIMLSLATHEPNFRVLREDVFFQGSSTACRTCGQEGHYAAQCTGTKVEKKPVPPEEKPFIFLDVPTLREYLEAELNVPQMPFAFNLEQAIDDWVLLIFFVGNDFLPHLPSLEIREGAIDTLLKIWRDELPRMGGYLTNHGELQLDRAQIILEGLARREDDIFRRRREGEERDKEREAKRQKVDRRVTVSAGDNTPVTAGGPSPALQLTAAPTAPNPIHPSLPAKPSSNSFAAKADSIGLGGAPTSAADSATATKALGGSNSDVVANRAAIRMANMSAAEVLKAEMAGLVPVKTSKSSTAASSLPASLPPKPIGASLTSAEPMRGADASLTEVPSTPKVKTEDEEQDFPGLGSTSAPVPTEDVKPALMEDVKPTLTEDVKPTLMEDVEPTPNANTEPDGNEAPARGHKRTIEEMRAEDAEAGVADPANPTPEDEDEESPDANGAVPVNLTMKVRPDGVVEQDDHVRLWEPGYRERYYRQKFGAELSDMEFKKKITTSYVEGMAWVLQYYYQGTPSWQWYYPYHFAPFASDFEDLTQMRLEFQVGAPFQPFEQLMGVFPAASRVHIPSVFHHLMLDEDSPIIDFYPTSFEIDMNGKKMAWQGVALLPFIDEKRLLDAMAEPYTRITEDEKRRNRWGNDVLFVGDQHPLYPSFEALYGKKKKLEPVPMDPRLSGGINGAVLHNPDCLPGATYDSPLTLDQFSPIVHDRSLSVLYYFPKQLTPHRSVLLPGVRRPPRVLTQEDLNAAMRVRTGGRGRGGDRGGRGRGMLYGGTGYQAQNNYGSGNGRGDNRDRGQQQHGGGQNPYSDPRQNYQQSQTHGYNGQPNRGNSNYGQYSGAPGRGGNSYGGYGQSNGRGGGHNYNQQNGPPGRGGGYGQSNGRGAYGGGYGAYGTSQNPPQNPPYGGYGNAGGYGNTGYGNSQGYGGGGRGRGGRY